MNSKKAVIGLTSLMAMGMMSSRGYSRVTKEIVKKNIKKPIPKGCQEFTIDGVTVIALNEKSALKKIAKLK